MSDLPKLLVIVGPTAIGKTALSLFLAEQVGVEIISADSRLFYRGMNIGTAKPNAEELSAVPHHLIDICDPDDTITLGTFQDLAYSAIDEIHSRSHLPILVGGTGQYVSAIVEGWGIPRVAPQPALRVELEKLGAPEVVRWLKLLDPDILAKHDANNLRRLVRALEVVLTSGQKMSVLQEKNPPAYDIKIIGLKTERDILYQRIDERVDVMIEQGLLAEVEGLFAKGYGYDTPAMSGIGYRQLVDFLTGKNSLSEAVERIKFETHRFVRHQFNWFNNGRLPIFWFEQEEGMKTAVLHDILAWLNPNV